MATLIKQWTTGTGNLSVTYEGDGDGEAIFASDINEGIDREMSVRFVGGGESIERVVTQEGMREILFASDGALYTSDGTTLNVLKG